MAPTFFPDLLYRSKHGEGGSTTWQNGSLRDTLSHPPYHPKEQSDLGYTVSVPRASARASLLPPILAIDDDDAADHSLSGQHGSVAAISSFDIPIEFAADNTAPLDTHVYNIDREALERLLQTEGDTFVATSSPSRLEIAASSHHSGWLARQSSLRWQKSPVMMPVMFVVALWVFATWYGRRKERKREVGGDEKGTLVLE